ncbi:MAG TPA: methylenetetrahydrofolate reductase [NAD(P)H] [Candidatus Paceibacterota bacterium]|nr:methylenetetrahydrofolate reductase [NAD(P)H] [Candidatus Paceibacterota bacterium]
MQLIRDIYARKGAAGRPVISFEFFPPKTDEGDRNLLEKTIPALLEARPDYCSVTYGAGGSTRDKTLMIVERIQRERSLTTLAHLTCVNHTREQVGTLLDRIQSLGCRNILALRGDPPDGGPFKPTPGGFEYAAELVAFTRERGDEFSIGVAGFPEGHIACAGGKLADWGHLKHKIEAGADFVITQLFFDNADFLALRDYLVKAGVKVPVVPGMIAILSASQIKRFTQICGARLPQALAARLEQLEHDDAAAAEFGIEYATRQCEELLREGVPGFHFYTLNKSRSTLQVLRNLGLA